MKDSAMTEGSRSIGPWTLGEYLGSGGNAEVWVATRDNSDSQVALKLINATKVTREPYQRFVREIKFLRQHDSFTGILPLVDAYLPEEPSKTDPPWLAMPIATPIARALEGKSLGDVVAAVAEIAGTLARLQRETGIAHRDIKPGNLYELDGSWLIGDFGLIAVPDAESLTADGKQLGPAHFTAYEMILDPSSADPHPADVYSLGKTLWVLATDQKWPPEGHQPAASRGFGIGNFRPHARAGALDQEVDLMTRLHPEERPSKEQMARDLAAWNELSTSSPILDLSAAQSRLRVKIERELDVQDTHDQYKELAYGSARRLHDLTAPLNEELKRLDPRAKIDLQTDEMTRNLLKGRYYEEKVIWEWRRCTIVAPLDKPTSPSLRMSRALELLDDGSLHLYLMVFVGPSGVMGSYFSWALQQPAAAPVGSIQAEQMLESGIQELAKALEKGVESCVDHTPDLGNPV